MTEQLPHVPEEHYDTCPHCEEYEKWCVCGWADRKQENKDDYPDHGTSFVNREDS